MKKHIPVVVSSFLLLFSINDVSYAEPTCVAGAGGTGGKGVNGGQGGPGGAGGKCEINIIVVEPDTGVYYEDPRYVEESPAHIGPPPGGDFFSESHSQSFGINLGFGFSSHSYEYQENYD